MQSVLDRALERYRRERFLRAAYADFTALKQDAKSWQQLEPRVESAGT